MRCVRSSKVKFQTCADWEPKPLRFDGANHVAMAPSGIRSFLQPGNLLIVMLRAVVKVRFGEAASQRTRSLRTAGKGRQGRRPASLNFNGLCNRKSILKLDTEVSDGAVHLRVAQQQLDRTQVARLLIDLRHLATAH